MRLRFIVTGRYDTVTADYEKIRKIGHDELE